MDRKSKIHKCRLCENPTTLCEYKYQKWVCANCMPSHLEVCRRENREYAVEWRKKNYEDISKKRKIYSEKNKERLRQNKQKWLKENYVRIRQVQQVYREKNKDRVKGMGLKAFWPELKPEDRAKEYNKILKEQNGVCAICKKPEQAVEGKTGRVRYLSVDHCHKSNKIRGLLCHACNAAIGLLYDNPETCIKASEYLKLHG